MPKKAKDDIFASIWGLKKRAKQKGLEGLNWGTP